MIHTPFSGQPARACARSLLFIVLLIMEFSNLYGCELQLLAPDPILSRFKSHKKGVKQLKRIGDVLTVVVVAGMLLVTMMWIEQSSWYSQLCLTLAFYIITFDKLG